MDVCDTQRRPLGNNNAPATAGHRARTREISSRYKSPTPSVSRRSPSPRTPIKRAQSAERRRPSTPPSPSRASTPVHDSSVNLQGLPRRLSTGSRIPESLWPSTMRSLSASFQSDIVSVPTSKKEKEKPVNNPSSDRTLRPSSNVAHRKPSPLKVRKAQDQSENAKPTDASHTRLIDQHRWPGRLIGKVSPNSSNKSLDLSDKSVKISSNSVGVGLSSIRRTSSTGSNITPLISPTVKPSPGSRPASPSRTSVSKRVSPARPRPSTPPSRGVSPTPSRGVSPTPSRGVSPTRTSSSSQLNSSASVLSFIVDAKKGKKSLSYIEDAHQIRMLYNRYLQWRFTNARAEAVLSVQKATAETTLYNVWNNTLALLASVVQKRMDLQELKLDLKLSHILNNQMAYLDDWASHEREHVSSLSGAIEDLEATTLRVPVTGGAKADLDSLKAAIGSAVDVMQAMGSSICSLLSMVEGVNALVTELAIVAADERAMLDECEALWASTAALQILTAEELRGTHRARVQSSSLLLRSSDKEAVDDVKGPIF